IANSTYKYINQKHLEQTMNKVFFLLQALGFFCQSLALNFGIQYAGTIGPSFQSFVTTASWCLMTSFLLLFCYVFSQKSFNLLKSSLFKTSKATMDLDPYNNDPKVMKKERVGHVEKNAWEPGSVMRRKQTRDSGEEETAFNAIASFSYITSCSYLGYAVNVFLQPMYLITPYYQVYPAMSAAYVSMGNYRLLNYIRGVRMVGTLLGVVYGYDAYKSYKYFKGYR
ncbi:hypothetical protein NQ318_011546, partial [Aromia moschata]